MSVVAPKLFQSSDTGAPTLSGTAGDLTELFASCLVLRRCFTAVSGASFTDRTAEARLQAGAAFNLFPTPGTNDEIYLGLTQKFERAAFTLSSLGVGGTYVFEYWSGGGWSAFSPTDGTAGFTLSGALTWSISSLINWFQTVVNGITCYWIRIRPTVLPSGMPTVSAITLTGWSVAYSGTNQLAFQMGAGNQFFLNVNDNAPGAGTGKEARVVGYETMSAIGTGTNPFPTVAQSANGLFVRKSTTADATTRSWILVADDRTFYFACIPGDTNLYYHTFGFGDFYSFVSSDPYRTMIMARSTENVGTTFTTGGAVDCASRQDGSGDSAGSTGITSHQLSLGKYAARNYLGAVGAVREGLAPMKMHEIIRGVPSNTQNIHPLGGGGLVYPNTPDGGVVAGTCWMFELGQLSNSSVPNQVMYFRGRFRGLWNWCHIFDTTITPDRTVVSGSGAMAGKSFILTGPTCPALNAGGQVNGVMMYETSDTWETNV